MDGTCKNTQVPTTQNQKACDLSKKIMLNQIWEILQKRGENSEAGQTEDNIMECSPKQHCSKKAKAEQYICEETAQIRGKWFK